MKRFMYLAVLPLMMMLMTLTSCSKDDDGPLSGFDYPAEELIGTWEATKFNDIPWLFETTTATFNSDGTYYGKGYFGTGKGTFTAKGKTIRCYVEGELYCMYVVKSLSGKTAVLEMSAGEADSKTITLTCEKK